MRAHSVLCSILIVLASRASLAQERLQSSDLLKLRSVSAVEVSPDATRVAYTVENNDGSGRPYGQLWVMTLGDGRTTRFGGEKEPSGNPTWSPDSQWIAYRGRVGDKAGLVIAHPDGSGARFLAEMSGTNSPLPTTGREIAWSPDGRRIAYVSSVPGPETADATGDPIVITRYLYKPDAAEGNTRFNDNRRLHIFVVDVVTGRIDQLTGRHPLRARSTGHQRRGNRSSGTAAERIVLQLRPVHAQARRQIDPALTATENAGARPRWSPDGGRSRTGHQTRPDRSPGRRWRIPTSDDRRRRRNRREIGRGIDNRQGAPEWSADGRAVLFTVQSRQLAPVSSAAHLQRGILELSGGEDCRRRR
jgi:dipeptidyl aminopeptidase/acylaminoacyl peptidase